MIKIREAKIEDLKVLKEFEQEIINYERPYAPNLGEDPITYYDLETLIINKDANVLVANFQDEIVGSGYALIEKAKAYLKPKQIAYLGFMYVLPEYRGKGINGKLVNDLISWSKERNISEIQLDVYAENKSALIAYQKLGFKPDLLKMRIGTED